MNNLKIKYLLIIIMFCGILTSCKTYEKFTVIGTPGTVVYSPKKEVLGTIDQNRKLKIKIPSDAYYGYLYTRNEKFDVWVPFGLNTYSNSRSGSIAMILASPLIGPCIGLPIILAGGDAGAIIGMIIMVGGTCFALSRGFTELFRMHQISYDYKFAYSKQQSTNSDIKLTKFIIPQNDGIAVNNSNNKKAGNKNNKQTKNTNVKIPPSSSKGNSSKKSNLKKGTDLSTFKGSYSCNGEIIKDKIVVATYKNLTLNIKPINESDVEVVIFIDRNTKVFEDPEVFTINKKESTSTRTALYLEDNPNCKIVLSGSNVSYANPYVDIDDEVYTLSVKGTKNK